MQTENRLFDDLAKLVNGAAGTLAGVGREALVGIVTGVPAGERHHSDHVRVVQPRRDARCATAFCFFPSRDFFIIRSCRFANQPTAPRSSCSRWIPFNVQQIRRL